MRPINLTIQNYRCFGDTPATIRIGDGFTALVGPNNSGKTTFLRLVNELRPVWTYLGNCQNLIGVIEGSSFSPEIVGIDDVKEIYCNENDRPLQIQIDFDASDTDGVTRIILSSKSQSSGSFAGRVFVGSTHDQITHENDDDDFLSDGRRVRLDLDIVTEAMRDLANHMYIGPFRNIISAGEGEYYGMEIGTAFIRKWDSYKTGKSRENNHLIQQVTSDLERIFGYGRLEINAAEDRSALQVLVDGNSYRIREMGSGLSQFIIVLGSAAFRKPEMILIDEPELNLHPSLQAEFLTRLSKYGSGPVVFATHSLGLARSTAEKVYSFQRREGKVLVRRLEQTHNYAEFAGEMSFSAHKELGCDQILLVEGTSEVKAVQQFLRLLRGEHRCVIIPLGGSAMINGGVEHELGELTRLTPNVAALIDSEREGPNEGLAPDREAFLQICKKLGINARATERRAFENYLTEAAIQRAKGPKYRALAPFERLNSANPCWSKSENWQIAWHMTPDDIRATDIGQFLESLLQPSPAFAN